MDNIQEIWKDVVGYEGIYQVSDQGRVKNVIRRARTKPGKIISPSFDEWGYLKVGLSKNGKRSTKRIHRIVALAFHDNIMNKPQVNHKNGIKTDNSVDNLEWSTNSENMLHANKTGLRQGRKSVLANNPRKTKLRYLNK